MSQADVLLDQMQAYIEKKVESKCRELTRQVLLRALYYREQLTQSGIGHNYTGNLINTIVCAFYKNGTLDHAYLGSKEVRRHPIMAKMTNRKNGMPRTYYYGARFKAHLEKSRAKYGEKAYVSGHSGPDWDDTSSTYYATVKTNTNTSPDRDAQQFVSSYTPTVTKGYAIVLAYPVEYAPYIEKERSSTGMALVQDEYNAKKSQIVKWFVSDTAISGEGSSLSLQRWDEIFAANEAYRQGGGVTADDILNAMGSYRVQPGITITTADEAGPDIITDDPFGGAPSDDAPF